MDSLPPIHLLVLLIVLLTFPANVPIFFSLIFGLFSKRSYNKKLSYYFLYFTVLIVVALLWEYFLIGQSGFPDTQNTPVRFMTEKQYTDYISDLFNIYVWVVIVSIILFNAGHLLKILLVKVTMLFKHNLQNS